MPHPRRRRPSTLLALLALAAVTAAAGCATAAGPAAPPGEEERVVADRELAEPIRLRLGHAVRVGDGLRIAFERVEDDSRCPRAVVCAWAGDAAARFRLDHPAGQTSATLHTGIDPRATVHAGWTVRLVRLEPEPPREGARAAYYEAVLEVGRR